MSFSPPPNLPLIDRDDILFSTNLNQFDWFWMPTNNWTVSIVTTTTSNLSSTTQPLPLLQALPLIFLLATVVLLCIFGNILVILSVFTFRPLRTVQNFFIVSLAFSDMLVAIIVMPFHIATHVLQRWIFGKRREIVNAIANYVDIRHSGQIFCQFFVTSDIFLCTASILNLCAIAVSRARRSSNRVTNSCFRLARSILGDQ